MLGVTLKKDLQLNHAYLPIRTLHYSAQRIDDLHL